MNHALQPPGKMRAKYFGVYFRWAPHITARARRRLAASLPDWGLEVSVDGITGQSEKWPDAADLRAVVEAVRVARGAEGLEGVTGAIVPRGYQCHGGACACGRLAAAGDVNTDACEVADFFAASPPLVVEGF